MLRTLFVALAAALMCAAPAQARTIEQVADASLPAGHPCVGNVVVTWDTQLATPGARAEARGVILHDDGRTEPRPGHDRCEVTHDPIVWATLTPEQRCIDRVHEVLHLAGRRHTTEGIMHPNGGYYAPCAPMRSRILRRLAGMVPDADTVQCGRWQRQTVRCRAEWDSEREFAMPRVARFRVIVRGERFAIRRVK